MGGDGVGEGVGDGSDDEDRVVGVDVGGSKVLAGVLLGEEVGRTARRETPGRQVAVEAVEDAVVAACREVADGARLRAVGVAAAGFVDRHRRRVVFAPHLPWRGEDVRGRLEDRLGVRVLLENDATCAAHAEATLGAGRGAESVLVITLGTGIGGGVVLDGQVWRGHHGMAGEFGHQQVVPDGRPCECGQRGCWEQYCSGTALVELVRSRLDARASVLTDLSGGDPGQVTGPMVTEAASAGDPLAVAAFATVGHRLGVGLAGLVAAFDPERLVVGGGVSAAGELLLAPAREALADALVGGGYRAVPDLVAARYGPAAGLVGAAALAGAAEPQG